MKIIKHIVIVIDTSNYLEEYSEPTPFKAELGDISDDGNFYVKSIVTGKLYELYDSQILEALPIEKIKILLDMGKYGAWD